MRNNFAEVGDDGAQKIFEVTRDTFLAPSGWMLASKFQAEKAPEIARILGTHDIRAIAEVLNKTSRPILELLVGMLASIENPAPEVSQTLDGSKALQAFCLAGRSGGRLGYIWHEYTLRNWRIELTQHEYFGPGRHIWSTGARYLGPLIHDPRILTDEPIAVVKRFLETGRRATPHIGGPDQIVAIDHDGSRWITRPPSTEAKFELAASTLSAGIAINSPVINGGTMNTPNLIGGAISGATLSLDLNGVTTTINNGLDGGPGAFLGIKIRNNSTGQFFYATPTQFGLWPNATSASIKGTATATGTANLILEQSPSGHVLEIRASGPLTGILINGQQVLGPRLSNIPTVSGTAGASYTAAEQNMLNNLESAVNTIISRMQAQGFID
jgi:hypothetical protein